MKTLSEILWGYGVDIFDSEGAEDEINTIIEQESEKRTDEKTEVKFKERMQEEELRRKKENEKNIVRSLAINTYKKADMQLARIVTVFVTIGLFCICGFEHCVADMFYFSLYSFTHGFDKFGVLIGKLMYVTLGNIIGCMLIPSIRILRSKIRSL